MAKRWTTKPINRYYTFVLLFQLAMALSIAAMPIYFKQNDALAVYGMAYSAMAITGGFSFIFAQWVDKLGYANALVVGAAVYALALIGRLITHPMLAVMVAIAAGIGASLALLSIQAWTANLSWQSGNSTKLSATRRLLVNGGMLAGTGLVSLMAWGLGDVYAGLLTFAGALVGALALVAYRHKNTLPQATPPTKKLGNSPAERQTFLRRLKQLNCPIIRLLLGGSLLSGIYVGFLKPYVILLFIDYGLNESMAVLMFLFTTLVSMLASVVLINYHKVLQNAFLTGLLAGELVLVASYLLLAWAIDSQWSAWVLVGLMLVRTGAASLSSNFEEIAQYQLIDSKILVSALGFAQTLFLIGDASGSLFTSLVIHPMALNDYRQIFLCCGLVAFINVLLIARLRRITAGY